MSNLAVNVAIIRDEKILLTQRDDFETWILPGGSVEDGESIAQAAIRETKEETGLDVELTRMDRKELYELRDKSELSRQEFYLYLIKDVRVKEEIEIGNFE